MPSFLLGLNTFPVCPDAPLCLLLQVTCVLHLPEQRIAIMLPTIAAAATVLRALHSLAHALIQPLRLDSGSRHFAQKKAVAVKVSGGENSFSLVHLGNKLIPTQVLSPHQTTLATILTT